MFLQIQKIGKAKHKFKAKINFIKLVNQATEKGIYFKVKIQRGQHQIQAVSQASRKGTAKFANSQYVIPMTLFCDESQKKLVYLQKQAKIKAYQSDQSGKQIRKIGTKTIDLAEYAQKGILKMQIQLDPQNNTDSPLLTIQIFLQRQSDDSKSVDTYSSNNDRNNEIEQQTEKKKKKSNKVQERSEKQQKQSRKDTIKKIDKKQQISSVGQKQFSRDNKQPKKQRFSQDDNTLTAKGQNKKYKQPPRQKSPLVPKKYQQQQKRKIKKNQIEQNQGSQGQHPSSFSTKTTNKRNFQNKPQVIKEVEKPQVNQFSIPQQNTKKSTIQTQFNEGQSPELQAFLLKKALKQKQSQFNNLKRQHQTLKKTMQKLIQQTSSIKQAQKNTGYQKQLQQLKKTVVSKDILIDKLTTQNKIITSRQQQYEKTIMKLRHQQLIDRQKISDLKYRQAYLMQELFQTANKQALEEASRFLAI